MTTLTNLPTSYNRFINLSKFTTKLESVKPLRRFAYRYRFAKSFTGINAEGFGRALDTYNAITKLFFAYTAYESIISSSSQLHVSTSSIKMKYSESITILAEKIRNNNTLRFFLQNNNFQKRLKQKIDDFFNLDNDDVISIAYALRNSFAHGNLTTTDVGKGLAKDRKLITSIADLLLSYSDELFDSCIAKL